MLLTQVYCQRWQVCHLPGAGRKGEGESKLYGDILRIQTWSGDMSQ